MSTVLYHPELLNITIYNELFGLLDLIKLLTVNKNVNNIVKKYINKYYYIINNMKSIKIPNMLLERKYIYEINYWNSIFNKKLNSNELALYYAYFFVKVISNGTIQQYNQIKKRFLSYPNGYIKSLPNPKGELCFLNENNQIITEIIKIYDDNYDLEDIKIFHYNALTNTINKQFNIDIPLIKQIIKNNKMFFN